MVGPVQTVRDWIGRSTLILIVISATTGCPSEAPEPYRSLLRLPSHVLEDSAAALPEGEQVALFLYGMTAIHPPRIGLAYTIAERGEYVVPHIMSALDSVRGDWAKADLIWVLALIACDEGVDFSEDAELLGAVRGAVRTLREDAAKERVDGYVQGIEGDCGEMP